MSKIKKVFAIILSMAMILGMSLTTFAAISGAKLTVKGLATNAKQEVKIYEIYRLDDNDNLWVESDWAKKVEELTKESDLTNPNVLTALKEEIASSKVSASATKETEDADENGVYDSSVEFTDLQAGAYLVLITDSSNQTEYSTMVAVTYKYDETSNLLVANTDTEVVAKAESYTTTKEIVNDKNNDNVVEVGDLITYEIRTTVPFVSDGNPNEFWIADTLTGAQYYFEGNSVKGVAPKFTAEVAGVNIFTLGVEKPNPVAQDDVQKFEIDLTNLLTDENTYAGQEVIITYTAKVMAVDEITNTAISSNDPESDTGKTTAKTGSIAITKYGEEIDGVKPVLKGAEFVIYRLNDDNKKEYAGIDDNGYVTGVWYSEEDGKVPANAGHVTTNDSGVATVKGLDVGTYYFKEVVAPDGYSINTTDTPYAVITKDNLSDNDATMTDTKLSSLPSTGGIGTTIFTIGGCAIMIAAAGLYFASRRKESK